MSESWKRWEGQVVDGRYPLLQFLGGGERSAVYLTASDDPATQKAAIKLVQANPEEAELRLERWEAASRLRHAHLVRLFQSGRCQLDGTWLIYLVMECADEDLEQVLAQRPLSAAEAREALEPTLDALAYLHARDFVLTNLRPANILAVGDQLRLASEHLRRAGEAPERVAELNPYDAPELARGVLTPAADVWSLGVTLVAALTQRLPVWDMAKSVDPVLPPGLPEPFTEIVRHSLQRDPAWRWTVEQIQARLGQAAPTPVAAAAAPAPGAAKRRRRRLGVVIGLVMLAVLIGIWVFSPRPAPQPMAPKPAPAEKVQAEPERKAAPAQEQAQPEESAGGPSAPAAAPVAAPETTPPATKPAAAAAPQPAGEARGVAVPGEVAQQVMPDVLPKARASIQGSVKLGVKVRVDATGKVVDALPAPAGPSKYFLKVALEAARRWKFRPARAGDQNVASEWLLRFEFEQAGTTVKPQQLAP